MKVFSRFLIGCFVAILAVATAQAQGFGGSVAAGDGVLIVGETGFEGQGTIRVLQRDGDGAWVETQRIAAPDADGSDDRFGRAMAMHGDVLFVGGTTQDEARGAVYVFERQSDGSFQFATKVVPDDVEPGHNYGRYLSFDGTTALATTLSQGEGAGAVYVIERGETGGWQATSRLTAPDAQAGASFGLSTAVAGEHALIGTGSAGKAYHFMRTEEGWTFQSTLEATSGPNDAYGWEVYLQPPYAAVGAPRANNFRGMVHLFMWDGSAWQEGPSVTAFDGDQSFFGMPIEMVGNELWVGARFANGSAGAVYRYLMNEQGSGFDGVMKMSRMNPGDGFGGAFAGFGDAAIIGGVQALSGAGQAYVYELQPDGWTEVLAIDPPDRSLSALTGAEIRCSDEGEAAGFECSNVDMLSFLPIKDLGGERGVNLNDIWGWEDPETGQEWAIVGRVDGTAFVDVSDPYNPQYVGSLPLHEKAQPASWRDIKVFKDHAFIVADGAGPHGVQVFDLTQLREYGGTSATATFEETAHYDGVASSHNIVINEESGYAYMVGNSMGGESCGGGYHIINLNEPANPTFAGCWGHEGTGRAGTGYSHDAQCVIYRGPDAEHAGKEICFGANETAVSIADLSDKSNPVAIAVATYPNTGYTHQGWLTDDQRYFYVNDELDETTGKADRTRTLIYDVTDLDEPELIKEMFGATAASDHNLYVDGNLMYQSNYKAGLRIFDVSDMENPVEVGYFDTHPGSNSPGFEGSWSNYPYFRSGTIIVSSIGEGLFVLRKRQIDA